MSTMNAITHAELLELLEYTPETGVFVWKQARKRGGRVGDKAGSVNNDGYVQIKVNGRGYKAHRLAWFYVHGAWPKAQIDHINGERNDNRIKNLREATHKENHQNRKSNKNSTSKYVGVCWIASTEKFKATIKVDQVNIHIGYFDTEEEAFAAYCEAKRKLHPFNPMP